MDILRKLKSDKVHEFITIYFGPKFYQNCELNENVKEIEEFHNFLFNNYQIHSGTMTNKKLEQLLLLDGLMKVEYEMKMKPNELDFGSFLIAAFSNYESGSEFIGDMTMDYHFLRYSKDGWLERHCDMWRKKMNKFGKLMKEIPIYFENQKSCEYFEESMSFIGYFLVPNNINVSNGVGGMFRKEMHKI